VAVIKHEPSGPSLGELELIALLHLALDAMTREHVWYSATIVGRHRITFTRELADWPEKARE